MRLAQQVTSRDIAAVTSQLQGLDVKSLRDNVAQLSRRADAAEAALVATQAKFEALASQPAPTTSSPRTAPPPSAVMSPVPVAPPMSTGERPRVAPPPAPTPQAATPSTTAPSPTQARPAPKSSGSPEQEYAAALATYRAHEHGQAVIDFLDFIAKYPKHPLGGNAQYWIGEAYWAQRDYRQALVEFEKVFEHGPAKAPDALLKIGLCHLRLNDVPRAQKAWQRVVNEYPKSEPAAMARSLIATHSSAGR